MGFKPTQTIKVTSLGYYDETQVGLLAAHEVGIFDSSGNLIADATVPSGASPPLIDSIRYQSIAPVTLLAGHVYNLEGETGSIDP